jgi:hypothetical protein
MVSDKSLLDWFTINAQETPGLGRFLASPLSSHPLPSLYLYTSVVALKARDTVLDAMRLMSDYGISSVAVLEEEGGSLLSAVSVTDIGKVKYYLIHYRMLVSYCASSLYHLRPTRFLLLLCIFSFLESRCALHILGALKHNTEHSTGTRWFN